MNFEENISDKNEVEVLSFTQAFTQILDHQDDMVDEILKQSELN